MHFCPQELFAILAAVPIIGIVLRRVMLAFSCRHNTKTNSLKNASKHGR